MLGYILRRILQLVPVLIGVSFITFALSFIVPGDPVRSIMGQRSDREIELRIRRKFGLDKPWYVQYFIWARNLIRNPGDLPRFKLKVESSDIPYTLEFAMEHSTVLATGGLVREVTNQPFSRLLLEYLAEPGCTSPDTGRSTGGTTVTLERFENTPSGTKAVLKSFGGEESRADVDANLVVCGPAGLGGIEVARNGVQYQAWFRPEGFSMNREFSAIFDSTHQTLIDGMFDDISSGAAEVRQLVSPVSHEILKSEHRGGIWYFTLDDGSDGEITYEMMPNAVLMLGGNRSEAVDFKPGMRVNVALTSRQENMILAVYDAESAGLPAVDAVRSLHPESATVTGRVTEITLSPAVWFDFGRSYRQQREVRDIIHDSFKNTAYLSVIAMLIAILVGITAGIVSAVKPYSALDYITMTGALFGVSMPVFWLGLMLILLFQGQLHWVSGIGFGEVQWFPLNLGLFVMRIPWHQQVILPAVTLSTVPMAIIARMTRSSMLEVMNLDYVRTARAKGLSEWTVVMRHALKNALIPIITVIGVDFAILLAGAVLTETVFSWPGLGREIVDAIEFRDFPVVMGGVVLFAFVFVAVNLVVDVLYAYVDPRIRFQ